MSWLLPSLVVGLCFAGLVNSWPMESKSCLNRCHASLNLQLTPSKMDIFGLVLTVRLKESLGNVRAPLRTALASWAPSINIIIIIIIITIFTTTKCVSPISRNMAIIKALLSSFGSSSERIIHPFLTSSSIAFTSYLLPFFRSIRFGPAPFFDCFATIYERTWRGNEWNWTGREKYSWLVHQGVV